MTISIDQAIARGWSEDFIVAQLHVTPRQIRERYDVLERINAQPDRPEPALPAVEVGHERVRVYGYLRDLIREQRAVAYAAALARDAALRDAQHGAAVMAEMFPGWAAGFVMRGAA